MNTEPELRFIILIAFIGVALGASLMGIAFQLMHNQTQANKVANGVTNRPVVTETEVYKVVCTVDGEGYCKEYSVRKINRE